MTAVTGSISLRDVSSSELSQSRVIVQIGISCLLTSCSFYVIAYNSLLMMNEAQPSNLLFYWEVWFLLLRCCVKKMTMYWGLV